MLRNTRVQMAAVLAVGALLGCLATSGRLSPFPRACAGQSLAQTESSSGARPACRDEVNRGQLLALAAPEETAAAPEAQTGAQEIITFVVRLPADAVLEIDGKKTQSTGEERRFETPPLRVGGTYRYTLKATAALDTEAIALPREALSGYFATHPDIGYVVSLNLSSVIGQRLQLFQAMWLREVQRMVELRCA